VGCSFDYEKIAVNLPRSQNGGSIQATQLEQKCSLWFEKVFEHLSVNLLIYDPSIF